MNTHRFSAYALYENIPIYTERQGNKTVVFDENGKELSNKLLDDVSDVINTFEFEQISNREQRKTEARNKLIQIINDQGLVDLLLPDSLFVVQPIIKVFASGIKTMTGIILEESLRDAIEELKKSYGKKREE